MKFLRKFNEHTSYEAELNRGGVVNISLPNVSYCEDVKDVHFNPYNTVEFYVGEITPPQTVKIYTDANNHLDVTVSEGNKWYSYLLPKDKVLFRIEGDSVKKVIIKADINTNGITIIPNLVVEASFKGSNTSKVTNMREMFFTFPNITSLDVSSFDTSKVTNMTSMFEGCVDITSLDVSSFNTSNVTDMNNMFEYCSSLQSLDLSHFNTSNVTNMDSMFYGCESLQSLDVSHFDTSNVTNMSFMFGSCGSLTTLDISNFDTSKVTYMSGMFDSCYKLTTIRMIGCNQTTIDKIKSALTDAGILNNVTIVTA